MTLIDDNIANIALSLLPKWNRINMLPWIENFGTFKEILQMGQKQLDIWCIQHLAESYRFNISNAIAAAEKEVAVMRRLNIELVAYQDVHYPSMLKACQDAPVVLSYKGTIDRLAPKALAIVGTRTASRRLCQ